MKSTSVHPKQLALSFESLLPPEKNLCNTCGTKEIRHKKRRLCQSCYQKWYAREKRPAAIHQKLLREKIRTWRW